MHIAIFYRDFDSTVGDAYDVQAIAREFLSDGHHVSIFCSENRKNEIAHCNIAYHRSTTLLGLLRNTRRIMQSFDVAHLFCGFIPSIVPVSLVLRAGGVPFVYSPFGQLMPRGFERSTIKKNLYVALLLRSVLRNAKFVHSISEYEASVLSDLGAAATRVVPLAIEGYELVVDADKRDARTLITYLGRLDTWHKGLDILLPALGQCRELLAKKGLRVVLAGRATEAEQRYLWREIVNENLDCFVELRVDISEQQKAQLLNQTALFVHPSRLEGFARSMREAMSLRLPIITTYDSNMGNWIEAHSTGQSTKFNVTGLADAIKRQLDDENHVNIEDYERLVGKLRWKPVAGQLLEAYVS